MYNKNKFSKKFLTIVSLTLTNTFPADVLATARTTAGDAYILNGQGFEGEVFNNGDSISLGNPADNIYINAAYNIPLIDLNGLSSTSSIIAAASGATVGAFSNGAAGINLIVNDNVKFSLDQYDVSYQY